MRHLGEGACAPSFLVLIAGAVAAAAAAAVRDQQRTRLEQRPGLQAGGGCGGGSKMRVSQSCAFQAGISTESLEQQHKAANISCSTVKRLWHCRT